MRVYLVRHGQTAWNAERRFQGHTDIPLDAHGLEQAERLASAIDDPAVTRILSSDLQRAQMTAAPLAKRLGLPVAIRRELRERSIGEWEAKQLEDVEQLFLTQQQLSGLPREEIRPPGGESMVDSWHRMESIAKDIADYSEPQIVIVHGGTGAMLLGRLLKATVFTARSFRFDNATITTVARRDDGTMRLVGYNDSSHLSKLCL